MQMLKYFILFFINSIYATAEVIDNNVKYTQQLLFGQDTKPKLLYWCDIKILPKVKIDEVTIFLKTNTSDKNSAIAHTSLIPENSPITPNAFRVYIPHSIIKNSSYQYTFQFSNYDSTFLLFSEPFIYDSNLQNFCLLSGSRSVFLTKQRIVMFLLITLSVIVVFILGLVLKKIL